jgi:hypothetical protein
MHVPNGTTEQNLNDLLLTSNESLDQNLDS